MNFFVIIQSFVVVDDDEHNVDDISDDAHDDDDSVVDGCGCGMVWSVIFEPLLLLLLPPFAIIPIILRFDLSLSIRFCRWTFADSNSSILVNASRS